MNGSQRRMEILNILAKSRDPVTGTALAKNFDVSRQVIVQDIAILRAEGKNIIATPQGYMIFIDKGKLRQVIACRHNNLNLKKELNIIVDHGATVLDVIVEHPIYGELKGILNLKSRHDVDAFLNKLESSQAKPLCFLTEGVHLHTIEADDQEIFKRIERDLTETGILLFLDK